MKKETIDKIEDEINKKTTMPNNLKDKTRKEIFINISLAIGIIIYFILLIMGSIDATKSSRILDFKIITLVLLFIAICLFEIAYKKDNGKIAINGIEILLVAIATLFLPYIVFELDGTHQKYYILSIPLSAVYYIIKCIVISNRTKIKYEKQESDIKEITKKEEKKVDYLDEEIEEEKPEENVDKEDKNNEENKPKKRGRPKKTVSDLNNKTKKEENKKIQKNTKKEKTNINKQQENEEKPKKRGRPRKVVNSK